MTERERLQAVLGLGKPDRVPNIEIGYWTDALKRWQKEGLPPELPLYPPAGDRRSTRHSRELTEYFGLDAHDLGYCVGISSRTDPPPTSEVIDEAAETRTIRYSDGSVQRLLKSNPGIFHDLDWAVKSREDWERKRAGYRPGWHAISGGSPQHLPAEGRDFGAWVELPGFFWVMRQWMGIEATCLLFHDDPVLAEGMLDFWADYLAAQCETLLACLSPEYVIFAEDMAYNHGSMLSPAVLRAFFVPRYARVVSAIRSRGVEVVGIDSDGLPDEMIPVLYEAGITLWLPFEIQCRSGRDDLLTLGKRYPWLRMIGGVDKKALVRGHSAIDSEMEVLAALVRRGGYIPSVDHKVTPEASLDNYRYYLDQKARRLYAS